MYKMTFSSESHSAAQSDLATFHKETVQELWRMYRTLTFNDTKFLNDFCRVEGQILKCRVTEHQGRIY